MSISKLDRTLKRETLIRSSRGKILIMEITENQEIHFRESGKRSRVSVPLAVVNRMAIKYTLQQEYREKLVIYKENKKNGIQGIKKPKKPDLSIFS